MDASKLRYLVAAIAIIVGAVLVITGYMTGEQWANTIGGVLAGGGSSTMLTKSQNEPS
jgi:hypothetical protein